MNLYDFTDYKKYLKSVFSTLSPQRGAKAKLARHLQCQTGFISQVLGGHAHFSLEHAMKINEFLDHDQNQSHFFMLLVQHAKAGNIELKSYFKNQVDKILKERKSIESRIDSKKYLPEKAHEIYYSEWYYSAIHILLSIPEYDNVVNISKRLQLCETVVTKTIHFLLQNQLAVEEKGKFKIGKSRIHIPENSTHITRHHTNWRIQTLKNLDKKSERSLHYSLVMSLAEKDREKIKEILIESIEKTDKVMLPSTEEKIFHLGIDFFELV